MRSEPSEDASKPSAARKLAGRLTRGRGDAETRKKDIWSADEREMNADGGGEMEFACSGVRRCA
jgi:hypothetical protein